MTYRTSFSSSHGGRGSPYVPRLGQQDRSFSDLFEYVDAADLSPRPVDERTPSVVQFEEDDAPDVIHVKHMGKAYKLNFPPYSISESSVTVQEVRKRVADGLQQDVRRVRLVYKDRELKVDAYAIKKYGCKQNSELMVVVTEQLNDYGSTDDRISSGDDSGSGSSLRPPDSRRPRGLSSVRHRSGDNVQTVASSNGFLHPNGASQYDARNDKRRGTSPGRRSGSTAVDDRSSSTALPTSTPMSRVTSADPNTPMGKVQALQDLYYDKWLPEGQKFLRSPPSDQTLREKGYAKLSESIMMHVIEAADAIDLQGDQKARAVRKKVLGEAQEFLKKLDALGKSK